MKDVVLNQITYSQGHTFFNQKNKRNTYVFSYVLCIAQTL